MIISVWLFQQGEKITVGIDGETIIVYADSLLAGLEDALEMKGYRRVEVINRTDPVGGYSHANVLVDAMPTL